MGEGWKRGCAAEEEKKSSSECCAAHACPRGEREICARTRVKMMCLRAVARGMGAGDVRAQRAARARRGWRRRATEDDDERWGRRSLQRAKWSGGLRGRADACRHTSTCLWSGSAWWRVGAAAGSGGAACCARACLRESVGGGKVEVWG